MTLLYSFRQWEFQVGPSIGISAGDELWIARYILEVITYASSASQLHLTAAMSLRSSFVSSHWTSSSTEDYRDRWSGPFL